MNQESTSRRSSFALDRISNAELLRLGLAIIIPAVSPPVMPAPEPRWPLLPNERPGTIYVLQAPPLMPVKIGFTRKKRLAYRLTGLQTGCPYPLRVIARGRGTPLQEREIHALLAQDRLTGEWFDWTPRVQEFVASLKEYLCDRDRTCGHCHVKTDG